MSKFNVFMTFGGNNEKCDIGSYPNLEEACERGWDYAHDNGYTRSSCESHESVIDALMERNYCMLGYGPDCIEVEEVNC